MNNSVSVIIPCYNGEHFLREAIDSALNQTYRPTEVIVVDDGSTDASTRIADSYGSPVRVVRQSNHGESVARNRGMEEAKGEWVAFLDADDIWVANKLSRQLEVIADDVICVHTGHFFFGTRNYVPQGNPFSEDDRYRLEHVASQNPFDMSSLMVRRNAKARFPTWTRYGEDRLYVMDLVQEGLARFVDEPLTGIRRHSSNQTCNPRIEILRYESLLRWLQERRNVVNETTRHAIVELTAKRLTMRAALARDRRDWETYWEIRKYLETGDRTTQTKVITWKYVYPAWVYAMKDTIDALLVATRLRKKRIAGDPRYCVCTDADGRVTVMRNDATFTDFE